MLEKETCPLSDKVSLSVKETAQVLSLSERTVRKLLERPDFPALKVGYRTLVSRSGLEAWIARQAEHEGSVIGTFN